MDFVAHNLVEWCEAAVHTAGHHRMYCGYLWHTDSGAGSVNYTVQGCCGSGPERCIAHVGSGPGSEGCTTQVCFGLGPEVCIVPVCSGSGSRGCTVQL